MRFIRRSLAARLLAASRSFPAVILTGPRRAGKTTLLRKLFPKADYVLLEDPDVLARVREDPRSFVDGLRAPVILDEIQNAPELFSYVRTMVDRTPRLRGRWFLTGSHEASLMRGVTESMAGRAAVLQLLPLSVAESERVTLLSGGYPEAVDRPGARTLWFQSYVQTYLERDVRSVLGVRDLATFRRFLALVASRHGQILNKTDLAAPLGVSVPTIDQWLGVLDVTGQVLLVSPYFENLGKRIIKSPRLYVLDSGLACHLLGIRTASELERSPFLGALYEGYVVAEVAKALVNAGFGREVYYFRDQQGLEVDLLVPRAGGELWLLEIKATRTPRPEMARPLRALERALGDRRARAMLVHRKAKGRSLMTAALAPGVEAVDDGTLVRRLNSALERRPRARAK
jgi:hypothetical protein